MPIDTQTERRIAAREIGRNLGVAVEHLKVGVRLVGAGTVFVVGVGGLLAGFFGCYFGFVVSLQRELQSVNAEAHEQGAATEKAQRVLTADIAKLKIERDSAIDLAAKTEDLRVRSVTSQRETERVMREKEEARDQAVQALRPLPAQDVKFWQLASAFEVNRVAVESEFLGRRIRFRSAIVEIERDFHGSARLVVCPTDAEKDFARTILVKKVKGHLLFNREQEPQLSRLAPGHEVTVETTLTGGGPLGTPEFSGTVVVE